MEAEPDNLTAAELAQKLRVTKSFVLERASKRQWPHLRLGPRTIVFTQQHYEDIISLCERGPIDPGRDRETTRERNNRIRKLLGESGLR